MSSKSHHTHKDVSRQDLGNSKKGLFTLNSHSSDDLTRWTQQNILRVLTDPTRSQKEASERWIQHTATWKNSEWSIVEVGTSWFSLLDQLFFFGSLSSRVDVTFVSVQPVAQRQCIRIVIEGVSRYISDTERCHITINVC